MMPKVSIPFLFVVLMWCVHLVHFFWGIDFGFLGIQPRHFDSILGIICSPLIHGNWKHLFSNSFPLLILGVLLFLSYEKISIRVWCYNYLFTGIFVWVFARGNSYHIGASGIVYGLAAFLFFSGFFRMDIKAIAVASGVALFYGGMVWGVLPLEKGVSWESHLIGGIVGFVLAFVFRNHYKSIEIMAHEMEEKESKSFEQYLNNHS
ncbi:MAG: rhomboid family intramembrane serine protease [Chitinophagales bacterium]